MKKIDSGSGGYEYIPPDQNFDNVSAVERSRNKDIEYREVRRELNRKIANLYNVQEQTPGYGGVSQKNKAISYYETQARQATEKYYDRHLERDLEKFPATQQIIDAYRAGGYDITKDDIKNVVNWAVVNDAADTIIAGIDPTVGDPNVFRNVVKSMASTNPEMAALLPSVVEEKLKQTVTDPSILENIFAAISEEISMNWDNSLGPVYKFWNHFRNAATYGITKDGVFPAVVKGAMAVESFGGTLLPEAVAAWDATEPGSLNQSTIQSIRDSGNYSDREVDIAVELVQQKLKGDPYPWATLWSEKYAGDQEANRIIGGMVVRTNGDDRLTRLLREVEASNTSETGDIVLGSAQTSTGYNPNLGDPKRAAISDVVGIGVETATDPLNILPGVGRAFVAAKWSLTKLAPGAKTAAELMKPNRFGVNGFRTYLTNFTDDLNRIERIEEAARTAPTPAEATRLRTNAAEMRQRMTNQYSEFDEQLIEDFRKEMPRNARGKFDATTAAKWIDDTNDAFLVRSGEVAATAENQIAEAAGKRAALLKLITESSDSSEIAKVEEAVSLLDTETRAMVEKSIEDMRDAFSKTFFARVSSNSIEPTPLVPRMSTIRQERQNAINALKIATMPSKKVDALLAKYLPRTDSPEAFANDLADNAIELGSDIRLQRWTTFKWDSFARQFSSLPNARLVSLHDASSTRDIYRLARTFVPKRIARLIAQQWRDGDIGVRRQMLTGIVKTGAAVRGEKLTAERVRSIMDDMVDNPVINTTGVPLPKERYGVEVQGNLLPSQRAASSISDPVSLVNPGLGELPIYRINGISGEYSFVGSGQAVDTNGLATRVVEATPTGLLTEALRLKPNNSALKSMLNNIQRGVYEDDELNLLDNIAAAITVDAKGKMSDVEQSSGFGLVLAALTGDDAATKLLAKRRQVFQDGIESSRANQLQPSELNDTLQRVTPAQPQELAFVHSTNYPIERDADGNIILRPAGHYALNDPEGTARSSVHFTINSEVQNHMFGTWNGDNKLIVTSGKSMFDANGNPTSLRSIDSFWQVSPGKTVKLPDATVVSPYVDETKYVSDLIDRGIIQRGDAVPLVAVDDASNEVLFLTKADGSYTQQERNTIASIIGIPTLQEGSETESIRMAALKSAMQRQGVNSRPEQLGQWGFNFNSELDDRISRFAADNNIGQEIHQGTTAGILENHHMSFGDYTSEYPYNRFTGSDIDAYRYMIAGGRLKTQSSAENMVNPKGAADNVMSDRVRLDVDAAGNPAALHLSQTADYARIPTLKDFEELRELKAVTNIMHVGGTGLEHATNFWSTYTLAAGRTSLRNMLEELSLYIMMGKSPLSLAKGRAADQMFRRARPRIFNGRRKWFSKDVTIKKDANGDIIPLRKTSLGMFANKPEAVSLWLKEQYPESRGADWLSELIFSTSSTKEALYAAQEFARGNTEPMMELVVRSQAAHKLGAYGPSTLSDDDMLAFKYLAKSQHGMQLADEISEAGPYLFNGDFPDFMFDTENIEGLGRGVTLGKMRAPKNFRFGGYENVVPVAIDATGRKVFGDSFWWSELKNTLAGDGPIGEAAVRLLQDPSKAKREIAKIIRNDTVYGYKERFTKISDDFSIDAFASDYFENVFQHFTKTDGTLNKQLQARFITTDDEGKTVASWWRNDGEGVTERVTLQDLNAIPVADRPSYVFGRSVQEDITIPIAGSEAALFTPTRLMGWVGRQNARISRGPLFLSNYRRAWRATKESRKNLADEIARTAGVDEPTDVMRQMADELYARSAMDTGYTQTISYVDNPANRSNFAWKARNVSRYWRATEDFLRRMWRTAKTRPEAFYRYALTYQVLTDTGFIFKDDQGNDYFLYPGNELLQTAMSQAFSLFGIDEKQFVDTNPFTYAGKLMGVSPSLDIRSNLPTFMGPSAVGAVLFLDRFPQMKGLEKILLGQYSNLSGDLGSDILDAVVPPLIKTAAQGMDPDEIQQTTAQGITDAMAILIAHGKLDELTMPNGDKVPTLIANKDQVFASREYMALQRVGFASTMTRIMLRFQGMASPQQLSNTVTNEARDLGITGMKPMFYKMLDHYMKEGVADPWAAAFTDFQAMEAQKIIDGQPSSIGSFLPFTVGSFKDSQVKTIGALARVQATREFSDYWASDSTRDLVANGFESAAMFLAPAKGEFDYAGWDLLSNDLEFKVPKTIEEKVVDLLTIQASNQEKAIKRTFDNQAAALDPTSETYSDELRQIRENRQLAVDYNRTQHPLWGWASGLPNTVYADSNMREAKIEVGQMLEYIEKRDGKLDANASGLRDAISVYDYFSPQIDAIKSQSIEAKGAKQNLENQMISSLTAIKTGNPNTAEFVDMLINLPYKAERTSGGN